MILGQTSLYDSDLQVGDGMSIGLSCPAQQRNVKLQVTANLSSTAATAFISRTFYFNLCHFLSEGKNKIGADLGQECP
jgi:hypothetical protein